MAKGKRKISAAQRDKVAINTAKTLKQKGLLSKQTKLHGGKFISPNVLKKVRELQHVTRQSWTSIKVPAWYAKEARAEGYQVSNGRVVVPRDHDFIARAKRDIKGHHGPSGVKPVKGGFMSEVQVRFDGSNIYELLNWLEEGNLESLKLEHEQFAFRLGGHEEGPLGMSYRTFYNVEDIRNRLRRYNPNIDTTGFKLYRLHPDDQNTYIRSPREREAYRAKHNIKSERKGPRERPHGFKSKATRKRENMRKYRPAQYEKFLAKERERDKARYDKRKQDLDYVAKSRARALAQYHGGKGKKK